MAHSKSAAKWAAASDEDLRPWANNPDLFESYKLLVDAKAELAKTISDTSYIRLSGNPGDSELDTKPKEIVELEARFEAAEAAYQLAQQIESLDPQTEIMDRDPGDQDINLPDEEEVDDAEEAVDQFDAEATEPQQTISAVKYVRRKGPAIANVGFRKFRALLKALQAGDSTLSFSDARDKLTSSLRMLPKHFSGKQVKLDESIELGPALSITKKHNKGQFAECERSAKQQSANEESNFLHFSGNSTAPNNIITNKSPHPEAAEVFIMSRPRTGSPDDAAIDRMYRPHSVGLQVINTARRDEISGGNAVHLTPLPLPLSMQIDNPGAAAVVKHNASSSHKDIAAATSSPSPIKLAPLAVIDSSTNFIKETPRSNGFFATMMTEVPEAGTAEVVRASSPKRPKSSLTPTVASPSRSRLSSPKKTEPPSSRLGSPLKRVNFKSCTPRKGTGARSGRSTPNTPNSILSASLPRLHTGSKTL